jgi:hypothetical protein
MKTFLMYINEVEAGQEAPPSAGANLGDLGDPMAGGTNPMMGVDPLGGDLGDLGGMGGMGGGGMGLGGGDMGGMGMDPSMGGMGGDTQQGAIGNKPPMEIRPHSVWDLLDNILNDKELEDEVDENGKMKNKNNNQF